MFKKNNDLYQDENSSSLDKIEKEITRPSEKDIQKTKLKEKKLKEKKLAFILGTQKKV